MIENKLPVFQMPVEYVRVGKPSIIRRLHGSVVRILHRCRLPCPRYGNRFLAGDSRKGIHHIAEATQKALGLHSGAMCRGDAAAVGCGNDIHRLQMVGHITAAPNFICGDSNADARAFKRKQIISADLIIVRKHLADFCGSGFGIQRTVSHFEIVLGILGIVPA